VKNEYTIIISLSSVLVRFHAKLPHYTFYIKLEKSEYYIAYILSPPKIILLLFFSCEKFSFITFLVNYLSYIDRIHICRLHDLNTYMVVTSYMVKDKSTFSKRDLFK
jgi:hypothetical protein